MNFEVRSGVFINLLVFILLLSASFGCRLAKGARACIIEGTKVERKFDENGKLIYYEKTHFRSTRLLPHPHNPAIEKKRIWVYKDNRIIEKSFYKVMLTASNFDGETLKCREVIWDDKRKKTIKICK